MTTQTKIIIGLSVLVVGALGFGAWSFYSWGKEEERAKNAERNAAIKEQEKQIALAIADSFRTVHLAMAQVAEDRRMYIDSMREEIERFGKKIVFVRQYENDSIVGSIDLNRQHKLFTEWLNAAKDHNAN